MLLDTGDGVLYKIQHRVDTRKGRRTGWSWSCYDSLAYKAYLLAYESWNAWRITGMSTLKKGLKALKMVRDSYDAENDRLGPLEFRLVKIVVSMDAFVVDPETKEEIELSIEEAVFLKEYLKSFPEKEGKNVAVQEAEARVRASILEQLI